MKNREILSILALIFIVTILSISAVSAAEDTASDIISADCNDEIILDEAIDDDVSSANDNYDEEILSAENDLEPLGDDTGTYSGLSNEIQSGGNIELQHKYYTYDSGSTIKITTANSVINGNGAVIDMAGSSIRAFSVSASGVTIKNLTIKNANNGGPGGAIYVSGSASSCTVENCNFTDNKAAGENGRGGAVYFLENVEVRNCNFINNTASKDGGAVYFYNNGEVTNCNFTDNKATGHNSCGGAVYFLENGEVRNCNFTDNKATGVDSCGGAVYFQKACEVTNCNFTDNTATLYGGAVYFQKACEVTNCNFTNNKATGESSYGGAVYFQNNGKVTNCNFTNNTASVYSGGAVYFLENGEVTNCNFTNNTANSGGAVFFQKIGEVTNCNFTDNTATVYGGGAVYFFLENGKVTNCNFTDNTASSRGGAVYFLEQGNVTNCNFINNTASESGGGGIFSNNWYTSADTCIFKTDSDKNNVNVVNFPPTLNVDNFTTVFNSGEKIAFDLKTNISSLPVTNGNISINVYCKNNDTWVGNYNCLSGEEWLVELPAGSYYAIYNTEYAGFTPINRTIKIIPDYQMYANVTPVTSNNLTVNITARSNIPNDIIEGKLVFILPNGDEISANYDADGTWWATYEFDDYGDYEVKASYIGLDDVSIKNATISIRNIVPISVKDVNVVIGDDANVVVSVPAAINGQIITITVNGISIDATVNDGKANATFAGLPIGEYVIDVEYLGDGRNSANSTTAKLTVKIKTELTASAVTTTYNNGKNIVITLKDSEGNPVSGVSVTVDLNGAKNYTTDKNGQLKVAVGKLVPKTYTAKISFAGDDLYNGSSATAKVTINKINTKLAAAKVTATYNVNKYLIITLKDASGNPLAKKKITVKVGSIAKNLTTNSSGKVAVLISKLVPKTYTASISFAGDSYYNKSSAKATVVVKKATPKLTASAKTFKVKVKTKKYTITLKNNKGAVMKSTKVTLKVNGKTYSAKTNSKGVATFKITNLKKKGTFTAVVTYAGSKYYNKVTKKPKITVKK